MQEKKDAWYFFFQFFKHVWFPLPVRFLLLKSLKIFALQVVRPSFLGPKPRLFPPPGDVLFKKKNWTLKEVTTYTFLNECLSFPTNTPLHAVNMHEWGNWFYYKVVWWDHCLQVFTLKNLKNLGMSLLVFLASCYSIIICDTKYSVSGS